MTKPQTLMTGLVFPESPRWHADRLWFSDWGAHEIIAVDRDGTSEVITRVQSFPFCFDFLSDGRLLVVSDHLLLRREPDGSLVTHANLTGLSAYPWNEIVVDGRGNIYVNNVGFDFPGGAFAPGIIALATPDGAVRQVAEGVAFPNGMAVTPDNATLIVAESYANRLTAFDIAADGGLSNRRIWADTGNDHPDGICLDSDGAVWYADVGSKHCVRVRERGAVLQTIELDRGCFACMLGGADRKTLFIVANEWKGTEENMTNGTRTGQVLTVEASVPGVGWP
ncbi:MAG: SMP-30/gluconolactonase/LRE family protein [Chloroflexota bacterium]|nr:SMP-30/gluconolactonase/LRE family protein [Chloroflexota bacterium]